VGGDTPPLAGEAGRCPVNEGAGRMGVDVEPPDGEPERCAFCAFVGEAERVVSWDGMGRVPVSGVVLIFPTP
jgi:hypothetical protein